MKRNCSYIIGFSLLCLLFSCSKERKSNRAGNKMKDFIIELSQYAKEEDPNFLIVPQNGAELMFNNLDGEDDFDGTILAAVDGIGIEELFYNQVFEPDNERIQMLLRLKSKIPVFVSEYVNNIAIDTMARVYNYDAGFIPFLRDYDNYDYHLIPNEIDEENSNDILSLKDARNYLYLIDNRDYVSKKDFLTAVKNTNYDVIIMDAFLAEKRFQKSEIEQLKTKLNGGKRLVLSYISIGSAEKYRYYWEEDWKVKKPRWLAKEYEGYEDEIWVKFWKQEWKDIIYGHDRSYVKKLIDSGFDGAYLDNVEAYYFLYFDE